MVLTDYKDDLSVIKVAFIGAPESPYAGGTFNIDIMIPDNFPFKSPKVLYKARC